MTFVRARRFLLAPVGLVALLLAVAITAGGCTAHLPATESTDRDARYWRQQAEAATAEADELRRELEAGQERRQQLVDALMRYPEIARRDMLLAYRPVAATSGEDVRQLELRMDFWCRDTAMTDPEFYSRRSEDLIVNVREGHVEAYGELAEAAAVLDDALALLMPADRSRFYCSQGKLARFSIQPVDETPDAEADDAGTVDGVPILLETGLGRR